MTHMVFSALMIFVVYQTGIAPIHPGCENCGCCVNNICAPANVNSVLKNDVCTYGCIDGIGGNKCYNKCPDDCVTCEQTIPKNCATCKSGKYLHTHNITNKRCEDCPIRCKTCTSSTNCQECLAPYYNSGSTGNCSSTCPARCKSCTSSTHCLECNNPYYNDGDITDCSLSCPRNCVCSTLGICSSCQDGYYNIQSQCQDACPDNCKTCSDQNTCQSCNDGFYNGKEYDDENSHKETDCSLPCRENCTRCDSYNQCTQCKQGKYGTYCMSTCSVGCHEGICTIGDGSCECKGEFTGPSCSACVNGMYGETCNESCPTTCKDNKCSKDTGHCNGCISENITGDICDTCSDGFYGASCDKECRAVCNNELGRRRCERKSGICSICEDGFYGNFCNLACSNQCLNNRCDKDSGYCSYGCLNGYEGPTCAEALNYDFRTLGMAIGISSAVTIVITTISTIVLFIILRQWFRKACGMTKLNQEPRIQASYVNTEFQPGETVHSDDNAALCDFQEYEKLNERNQGKTSEYEQI